MDRSPLISLRHVNAGYEGRVVVSDVSFDVYHDDVIAVIGPNGGGKTTILRILLNVIKPMSGSVYRLDGLKIGYLPQINDVDLSFPISVIDVVLSGQMDGNRLFPSKATRARAMKLLEFAQLQNVANEQIGDLSGGQRQRVFLCRALMGQPQLLVLDEPVTYMDKVAETNLYRLLPELAKDMAIVLVSHDIGAVPSFAKSIACVNRALHYHESNKISDEILNELYI